MQLFNYSSNLFLVLVLMVFLLYLLVLMVQIQRRDQRKKSQKEFIYSTFIYCTTNVNFEHEWEIMYPKEAVYDVEKGNENDAEFLAAELKVFYIFNSIAVGIQSGGLDNDTVYWLLGHDMKNFFFSHKYRLAILRNKYKDPYLYINYEMLMTEWEELRFEENLDRLKQKKRYLS